MTRTSRDRNWDLLGEMLGAEASGKSPRLFSSRKTLFGIPSALDQELEALSNHAAKVKANERTCAEKSESKGKPEDGSRGEFKGVLKGRPKIESNSRSKDRPKSGFKDGAKNGPTHVKHPLKPIFDDNSRVLILGTMPSPKSRETGFYYNHPQNRFWRVMAALLEEPIPENNQDKEQLLLRHGIALWDVLAECTIEGASDGTIAECVPNPIGSVLSKTHIEAIFCTGAKATDLYRKYCEPSTGIGCTRLPSTSPANAATSLNQLIEAYRAILPFCINVSS